MAFSTPRTWTASEVVTAAQLNQEIRDNLLAAFPLGIDAWTAYTPTLANITLGNGTMVAAYQRVGRMIFYRAKFTFGSTSAVGTDPTITLPVAPASAYAAEIDVLGQVTITDAGTANFVGIARLVSGSTVRIMVTGTAGTYANHLGFSATVPMTWATNDNFVVTGFYEAAS
jgi:hypothetical protein